MKEHQRHPRIAGMGSFGRRAIVLLMAALVTAAVFWQLRRAQLAEFRSQFESDASTCTALIRQETDKSLLAIKSLGWFIDGTGSLNARTFQAFADACLPERKELQALSWNPRVSASERPGFEQKARQDGQFRVTERGPDGRPVIAPEREVYYPVFYIEPLRGNETAAGFDVGSDPVRRAALERARDTDEPVVTEPIHLVQHGGAAVGFLIFVPVYRERLPQAGVAQRRASLEGFAVGVYEAGAVVSAALGGVEPKGLSVAFLDRTAPIERQLMYRWDNPLKVNRSWKSILFPTPPKVTCTFGFAGREWGVEVLAGPAYMQRYCPISCWLVLPAGLLLGLLTTSYIGAMLSGQQRLAQLVAKRTTELCQTQEMLQLVLDAIPVRVHWKNRASVYLGCNRRFAKEANLNAPQEVVGKTDYDLPWKEYAELDRGRDQKVIESGQPMLDYEQPRATSDGRVLTLLQSKLPLRDAGGGIIGVLSVYEDITKRKEADEALRESEARYRAVVENSPDGMAVSMDNELVYVNPAAVRLAGARSAADLLGRSVLDFVHEDYRAEVERRRVKVLETGLPSPVLEGKLRRPDGGIIVAESTGVPILYGGKPAILNSFRDVTEHRRRDRALRASEAKYRQLHESMMDALVATDLKGRLAECNEAFRKMLGYEPEEILTLNTEDWTPEKWHALDAEIRHTQVLARGYSDVYEKEYRRKDGTVFPVELRVILLKDDTGTPCGMWAIVRDITERKQAEGLLAGEKRVLEWIASRKPLPEALNEICRFIDELSAGVMSSILLLEPGGTHLRPIAAPSLPEEWTRAITPLAIGPSVGSCGTAAWDKEQVIVSDITTDPRWTTYPEFCALALKCGLRACWSTPILSAEGAPLGTFAMYYREPRSPSARDLDVIRQVTHLASIAVEHHQAAEALRRARDELEQRVLERTAELVQANHRLEELDRLKSQFLATMSHELRTPLNSIIGFTSILRKGFAGPVNEEQHKELGMVFGSAKHLLSLINDLLDLSRIEAGKVEIESEPFNFVEVIEEVVHNLTPLAGQKNLRLATDLPGPAIEMVGDRKRSYQVLLNLANNAVKFTDHGEVKITARAGQEQLRVCVTDTGIGIKREQMGMLFEAFRQLDGTARRVYEGTGLGLHLCRRLLTLMHGEIGVESEFGKGSRFTITLPRHGNGQPEPSKQL